MVIDPDQIGQNILDNPASRYIRRFIRDPHERAEHISIIITDNDGFLVAADAKPKTVYYGDQEWWKAGFDDGRGQPHKGTSGTSRMSSRPFLRSFKAKIVVSILAVVRVQPGWS